MRAAAQGDDYHISFGGKMQFHYASDVALQFIAAAEQPMQGAFGFNLGTVAISVETVAQIVNEIVPDVSVTVGDSRLPFPEGFEATELNNAFATVYETPLREAIMATIDGFRAAKS